MDPLSAATLQGTWATLLLPLSESGGIKWDGIEEQLQALAAARVDGIYFNGTAGEFFSQSNEEFLRLARTMADFCEKLVIPFQVGASHVYAGETLRRIEQTRELKPGAFQVILPEWIPLAWDELLDYLRRLVAAAAPIPLVIYNPPNARRVLNPSEWSQIASTIDGIAGIKVAGGDAAWHEAMRSTGDRVAVFVAGIRLASGLIHGCARGSYSNLACLAPDGASRWGRSLHRHPEGALVQEQQIQAAFKIAIDPFRGKFSHAAIDKALAAAGGWAHIAPTVRWPLASIPETRIQDLSKTLRGALPFLFEDTPAAP